MELNELVERCREGDAAAWEALVRRYQGKVYAYALDYLRNPEEARDLAQEVFVRIYERLDRCRDASSFVPWMLRMTRNAAIDRIRRAKTRPRAIGTPVEEILSLASPVPSPVENLATNRRQSLVRRAMERLTALNREIVRLKEIEGLSFESVAQILQVPVGTTKSRSARARIELAREVAALMKEEGWPEGTPGRDV
ncbi:MAG: RNA polymerase sigma factor [Candidatus Eisenbacteria bacterium]